MEEVEDYLQEFIIVMIVEEVINILLQDALKCLEEQVSDTLVINILVNVGLVMMVIELKAMEQEMMIIIVHLVASLCSGKKGTKQQG